MTLTALTDRRKNPPLPTSTVSDDYRQAYGGKPHHIRLFPAAIRKKEIIQPEALIEGEQSSCYFHPNFPATTVCAISGRFICDLCTTEWEGEQVSLTALQEMHAKGNFTKLETERILWDDIALVFALFFITGPVALIIALWFWRKGTTSLVYRNRIRYIIAGFLGAIETIILILIILAI